MRTSEVAKRYARALYSSAKDIGNTEKIFAEVREIQKSITSDAAVTEFINSSVVAPETKKTVLQKALSGKVSETTMNFLSLLADKNRLSVFVEIAAAFEEISDEDHGVTRGHVKSATTLSPEARKKIEEVTNKVVNKKVILTFSEDPKLLGGSVAQVGGWTFDDSLEMHLRRMGEDLNRRTN